MTTLHPIMRVAPARFTPAGDYDIDAGQARIRLARVALQQRTDRINAALSTLRTESLRTDEVPAILHAISAGLGNTPYVDSGTSAAIELLDGVADEIEAI